jgi:uncharacterized membrane protein
MLVEHGRDDMATLFALILAVVGGLFVYLALQAGGGLEFNYLMVAFIAFVNAALCAAALFAEE